MPRIYAPNEAYKNDWAAIPADRGVVILPEGANTGWFAANSFEIDNSKHVATVLDELTPLQLRQLCGYLKITIDAGASPDTKQELVRAIETEISGKYLGTVVADSVAGSEAGKTKITITGAGAYKYKTAKDTAPAILYLDYAGTGWKDIANNDQFTPTATHNKITIVEVNAAGYVVGSVSKTIVTL